jgi:FlgD Ig-like domain
MARAVARFAPAALVAALLLATALAFAYTESLKLTRSPILRTKVTKVFSPVCDCSTDSASVSFQLRKADVLDVEIVDGRDRVVRSLVTGQAEAKGLVSFVWDGRDDADRVVDDGSYQPRVRLERQHRTILLPNPIRVDTTAPTVVITRVKPRVFSPDGDRRADRVLVSYRADEPVQATLYVDGVPRVVKRGKQERGEIAWAGRIDGEAVPRGSYRLAVGAVDVAGNVGVRTPPRLVVVRYVALGRDRVDTRPGARFAVRVASDARRVRWRLGSRTGVTAPGTLTLRAPLRPGRYTLSVSVRDAVARAAVIVREPSS